MHLSTSELLHMNVHMNDDGQSPDSAIGGVDQLVENQELIRNNCCA